MFPGFHGSYLSSIGDLPCQDMVNLQKHYSNECEKNVSQYRAQYMNMFGLVQQPAQSYANHVVQTEKPGGHIGHAQDCPEGEKNKRPPSEGDRPCQVIPKPVEVSREFAAEQAPAQNNTDKARSRSVDLQSNSSGETSLESRSNKNDSPETRCDICGDVTQSAYFKKVVQVTRCGECVKYFQGVPGFCSPSSHTHRRHGKLHSCQVCSKEFVSTSTLKTHARVHSGDRPYQCTFCDKTFLYEGNMKTHMRTHTGEKPFTCDKCGKSFSQSGTLKKHLRMHSGEKPYKCEYCDKTFAYSENLIPHRRVHSGEKPFNCDLCEKTFSQPGSLKTHMKTAHTLENFDKTDNNHRDPDKVNELASDSLESMDEQSIEHTTCTHL